MPTAVGLDGNEGLEPGTDATVVSRVLDAGATIVGTTTYEHARAARNPHDPARSAGGPGSGSAVVVATGEAEGALARDSAGSGRVPAGLCGVYGLKPTHGLAPTDGVLALDRTLDHVGLIAPRVDALEMLLATLTGAARERAADDVDGIRVGVLQEGFGWPGSEADVDRGIRAGAAALASAGAKVADVSLPLHREAIHVYARIATESAAVKLISGNAGRGAASSARAKRTAKALRDGYDALLRQHDVLVLPTTPMKAPTTPSDASTMHDAHRRVTDPIVNACAFNVTGHPAISIPCGQSRGLPLGLMAVAAHGREDVLLRLARTCAWLWPAHPPVLL